MKLMLLWALIPNPVHGESDSFAFYYPCHTKESKNHQREYDLPSEQLPTQDHNRKQPQKTESADCERDQLESPKHEMCELEWKTIKGRGGRKPDLIHHPMRTGKHLGQCPILRKVQGRKWKEQTNKPGKAFTGKIQITKETENGKEKTTIALGS